MTDESAAETLVSLIQLMPRVQAAYAAGDFQTVKELMVYSREYSVCLQNHATQKLAPVPAVERPVPVSNSAEFDGIKKRPMIGAYFPGQF